MKLSAATNRGYLKIILVLLISTVTALSAIAQGVYNVSDSVKIFSLLNRADSSIEVNDYDSAMHMAQTALQLSNQKKMIRGQAYAYLKIADIFYRRSEVEQLGKYDSAALKIAYQLKDSFLMALSLYQVGVSLMSNENYQEALNNFHKALALKFEKDRSAYTAIVYNDIGYTYGLMSELDKQMEWYLKVVRIYDKVKDLEGLGRITNNLAATSYELGNYREAIDYAKQSIAIREKLGDKATLSLSYNNLSQYYLKVDSVDKAIHCQQLGLKYAEMTGIPSKMIHSYISMSLVLNKLKKNAEALDYEKRAIALLEKSAEKEMLSRRYISAAFLSSVIKDTAAALDYYKKAYQLASATGSKANLRDVFLYRSGFYKNNKDYYNAYEDYKMYIKYRDSIINSETNTRIADLQLKYESEKKDNEIAGLNTEQKIKQLQIEKQKAIIAGNLLEAQKKENEIELLSGARELQDLKIQQQDEQLEKQLLLAKTNEQQLQLAEAEKQLQERKLKNSKQVRNFLLAGFGLLILLGYFLFNRYQLKRKIQQQQELLTVRNSIAQDLHDEIGSTLTSIKILSQVSQSNIQKDQQKASSFLQKITEQSAEMQQGISDIVWAIKPDNDKLENMVTRMREYVAHTLETKNIITDFFIDEQLLNKTLNMQQRRDFFLIFKEAVNNIAKYAACTNAEIKLAQKGGKVLLSISDNGKGFDTAKATSSNGLKNIKARAAALKGMAKIQSVIGSGTTITLEIPAT